MEFNEACFEQFYDSLNLEGIFEGIDHVLKNCNQKIISKKETESLEEIVEKKIKTDEGSILFFLKIKGEMITFFENYLLHCWKMFIHEEKEKGILGIKEVLKKDLDGVLRPKTFKNEDDMKEFLSRSLLRLSISFPCDELKIFYLDNDLLREMASWTSFEVENEKSIVLPLDTNSIESISLLSEFPYHVPDTSELKDIDLKGDWKSYSSFPLYFGEQIIGVLSLKNLYRPHLTLQDFKMIEVVCQGIGNVLGQGFTQLELDESTKDNKFLSNYISKFLLNEIEEEGSQDRFKAMKKEVVSLFADIRSFTSISEKLDPKVLINLLNIYFEEVTSVIEEHYGTVDKLVGDMIMVKWNIPHDVKDARIHAVKAAVAMQKKMITKVVPHWKNAGVPMVGIGIGVDCGEAYVGNVGSSSFINYTAFGESVEVAAQLEALARPGQVLITDQYFKKVKGKIPMPYKQLRNIPLKGRGKNNMVHVIKTLDYPDYTSRT